MGNLLLHRFNPQIAELYGINAALIFQYIWYRSVKMAGGRYVAMTLDDICKQYPYLGRKQVRLALEVLVNSGKRTPALVSRKRTDSSLSFLYTPICRDAGTVFVNFDTHVALQCDSVVAALIYANILSWIKHDWRTKAMELYEHLDPAQFDFDDGQMQYFAYRQTKRVAQHRLTAKKWASLNPYAPIRTVERGLLCLQQARFLRKPCAGSRSSIWFIRSNIMVEIMKQSLHSNDLLDSTAKTTVIPPKRHSYRQNDTPTAKTTPDLPLSPSGSEGNSRVGKALSKAFELRSCEHIVKADGSLLNGDEPPKFDAPSVLTPRNDSSVDVEFDDDEDERNREPEAEHEDYQPVLPAAYGENSRRALSNPDIVKTMRILNRPQLPQIKKKLAKDVFGNPVKRAHVKVPQPDDPEYYEYLDSLTPEQQVDFLASGTSTA